MFYAQIKILTLQDRPLCMCEGGLLISKGHNSMQIVFSFFPLFLAAAISTQQPSKKNEENQKSRYFPEVF